MDPRTPPQIPPQPASAGLPPQTPQTYTSSPPKKGPRFWIIFVVIVILLMLAAGGFYTFTIMNKTATNENITQDNIAVFPTTAPVPKDNSAVVATSSANIDPANPNLMIYESPCVTLKYPNSWVKSNENMLLTHYKNVPLDPYGSTNFNLFRKDQSRTSPGIIGVSCGPNTQGFDFQALKAQVNKANAAFRPADSITETTISGLPAMRIFYKPNETKDYTQFGDIEIETINRNTIFAIHLRWDYPEQSNPNSAGQKEFEQIVNSIQIKDYF